MRARRRRLDWGKKNSGENGNTEVGTDETILEAHDVTRCAAGGRVEGPHQGCKYEFLRKFSISELSIIYVRPLFQKSVQFWALNQSGALE